MRTVLLASTLFLLGFAYSLIQADERFLLIPPHVWSDGEYHDEYIRYFKTDPWQPYTAHVQCTEYARWLHKSRISAPHYSACIDPSQLMEIKPWNVSGTR